MSGIKYDLNYVTDRTPVKLTLTLTPEMAEQQRAYDNNETVVTHKSFHLACGFYTFTGTKAEYKKDRAELDKQWSSRFEYLGYFK